MSTVNKVQKAHMNFHNDRWLQKMHSYMHNKETQWITRPLGHLQTNLYTRELNFSWTDWLKKNIFISFKITKISLCNKYYSRKSVKHVKWKRNNRIIWVGQYITMYITFLLKKTVFIHQKRDSSDISFTNNTLNFSIYLFVV